jgi:hypothetical protein
MATTQNQAKVKCEKCGSIVDLARETEEVQREERQMGAEIQYDTTGDATCECGNEIEYVESEWEYPEGVPNHQEGPEVTGGTLL